MSAGASATFGSPSYAMSADALPPPPAGVGMSAPAAATKFSIGNQNRLPKAAVQRAYPYQLPSDGSEQRSGYGGEVLHPPASAPAHSLYTAKPTIDHHLLSLIQQVTSTASGVWVALLEHLASLGVRGQHSSAQAPFSSGAAMSSPESTPTLAATRTGGKGPLESARSRTPGAGANGNLSPGPVRSGNEHGASALSRQGSASPSVTASPGGALSPQPPSQSIRKLVELREQCLSAAELTRRLQHTLEKVQDELDARAAGGSDLPAGAEAAAGGQNLPSSVSAGSPNPASNLSMSLNAGSGSGSLSPSQAVDARRLLDESVAFARAVTALLMQIKALSISHEGLTQPELKRALGALTSGCANLSVHLHFCAPYPSGRRPSNTMQMPRQGMNGHDLPGEGGYASHPASARAVPVRAMSSGVVGRPE